MKELKLIASDGVIFKAKVNVRGDDFAFQLQYPLCLHKPIVAVSLTELPKVCPECGSSEVFETREIYRPAGAEAWKCSNCYHTWYDAEPSLQLPAWSKRKGYAITSQGEEIRIGP